MVHQQFSGCRGGGEVWGAGEKVVAALLPSHSPWHCLCPPEKCHLQLLAGCCLVRLAPGELRTSFQPALANYFLIVFPKPSGSKAAEPQVQARRLAAVQVCAGFGFSASACLSLLEGAAASLGALQDAFPTHSKALRCCLQALPMLIQLQFRLDI